VQIIERLERDVFPWIGGRQIADVTAPALLSVLRRIESRGANDTAHRALQDCGRIFRYAVVPSRADRDISVILRGALAPVLESHYASIKEPPECRRAHSRYRRVPRVIRDAVRAPAGITHLCASG
jgi:integrase